MCEERWVVVADFPAYAVSTLGRVRRRITGVVLRPSPKPSGYVMVNLYRDKKSHTKTVHRLVAQAFLRPVPGSEIVNHINGVKFDNRLSNLEWATYSHNRTHCPRCIKYKKEVKKLKKRLDN